MSCKLFAENKNLKKLFLTLLLGALDGVKRGTRTPDLRLMRPAQKTLNTLIWGFSHIQLMLINDNFSKFSDTFSDTF